MAPAGPGQALRQRRSGPLLPETIADADTAGRGLPSARRRRRRRRRYPTAWLATAALLVAIGAAVAVVRPWRTTQDGDGDGGHDDVAPPQQSRPRVRDGDVDDRYDAERRRAKLRRGQRRRRKQKIDRPVDATGGQQPRAAREGTSSHRHESDGRRGQDREVSTVSAGSKGPHHETITCPGGTVGVLNDNYCDCSDGSDELGTSACSHILVERRVFDCADGSGKIFASRVQDGIIDCKDGSDEVRVAMRM